MQKEETFHVQLPRCTFGSCAGGQYAFVRCCTGRSAIVAPKCKISKVFRCIQSTLGITASPWPTYEIWSRCCSHDCSAYVNQASYVVSTDIDRTRFPKVSCDSAAEASDFTAAQQALEQGACSGPKTGQTWLECFIRFHPWNDVEGTTKAALGGLLQLVKLSSAFSFPGLQ